MDNAPTSQDDQSNTPEVLLIDDSIDVHRLLSARLRQEAISLIACTEGTEGIALAKQRRPALVLLDLQMPGIDGFEVLRTLKEEPDTREIPVIVLSGLDGSEDKVTAFDLGAVDYITKPFALMELRVRVRSALRLHHLLQMLAQKAQVDGLSGLWNRTHFNERWDDAVEAAKRHGRALSLALLDLDHFKSVNDTFGHPAGDAVIEGFAKILQSATRRTDLACRFGGEEFVVIMPETSPNDAAQLCERIRSSIEQIAWRRHPEHHVTTSVGIAGASIPPAITPAQWLEAADKALYNAKSTGRNRVETKDLGGTVGISKAG